MKICVCFLLIPLLLIAGCASTPNASKVGDQPAPPGVDSDAAAPNEAVNLSGFFLRPGDELEIKVWRHENISRSVRIDPDGRIYLPMAGEIEAAGKTVRELRKETTERLARYVRSPLVDINVARLRSNSVYVLGEVRNPGVVDMEQELLIWEAIAHVGGMSQDANAKKIILIRTDRNGTARGTVVNMDLRSTGKGKKLDAGRTLRRGDVICVPPRKIADIERFMVRLNNMVSPIMNMERTIIFGDEVNTILSGDETDSNRGVGITL
jgi:polysaccharide export outer membrane protein